MKIGFVGMGKLGFPVALAIAEKGHEVLGYDISFTPYDILEKRSYPYKEVDAQKLLINTSLRLTPRRDEVVQHADIVFCAIQTPHAPEFEGVTRLPEHRADFDYSWLKDGVREIAVSAKHARKHVVLSVISTVLPGTCERELYPLLNEYTHFVYNPFFIAMGTTISDFLNPEFVLIGVDDKSTLGVSARLSAFYSELTYAECVRMSVKSAELTKVAYNLFIGLKIVMANTVMEICDRTGANCDDVMNALKRADKRLISPRYLSGGMGDGGGCHPRDAIALSWLTRGLGMPYDLFAAMMHIREMQTEWIARIAFDEATSSGMTIVILGKAFKPETNITTGSSATLLKNILDEDMIQHLGGAEPVRHWDPETGDDPTPPWGDKPQVFVLATDHQRFRRMHLPQGSVLIDPWGTSIDQNGVKTIRLGRR